MSARVPQSVVEKIEEFERSIGEFKKGEFRGWPRDAARSELLAAIADAIEAARPKYCPRCMETLRPDPREPDYSRPGIFALHNCAGCQNGKSPCAQGDPNLCTIPRARND